MPAQSAKTIKQAKEAFKNRHNNPLTEKEQKQLQRSVALEQRAWGLRQREKSRQDAVKKRERKEQKVELGTQRKLDRHGFASSQFHLGKFFGKPGERKIDVKEVTRDETEEVSDGQAKASERRGATAYSDLDGADEFDDVDDESLLEALRSPEMARVCKPEQSAVGVMPPPPRPALSKPQGLMPKLPDAGLTTTGQCQKPMPPPPRPQSATTSLPVVKKPIVQAGPQAATTCGFDDISWDFLDSSTQIARELSSEPSVTPQPAAPKPANGSFSSGSFDLTEEDLEELDPTPRNHPTVVLEAEDRKKMPPPPPPFKTARSMITTPDEDTKRISPPASATAEKTGMDFTMTQLESFVDEDLQLTQIAPG